jgi:hypothetical protein
MKRLIPILLIALLFCDCGNKSDNSALTSDDSFAFQEECVGVSDSLYIWKVQRLIDSTSNKPNIVLSSTVPCDTNRNDNKVVHFTFSENCNPESKPIMIVILPVQAEKPLIIFSQWDENGKVYYSDSYMLENNNILVHVDSRQTHITLIGDFLKDMLEYQEMNVCYLREDAPEYKTIENDIYKQYVTTIPVDLYKFQEQYRAANKWMEDNK